MLSAQRSEHLSSRFTPSRLASVPQLPPLVFERLDYSELLSVRGLTRADADVEAVGACAGARK